MKGHKDSSGNFHPHNSSSMLSSKQLIDNEKQKRFLKKFFKKHSVKNQNCYNPTHGKNCVVCGRRIGKGERDLQGHII